MKDNGEVDGNVGLWWTLVGLEKYMQHFCWTTGRKDKIRE
jgi:hypothetical protein